MAVHRPPPVRVLITGFGPFPGVPVNASAMLIEAIAENPAPPPAVRVFAELLPVDWDGALERSREAISRHRPHAVLHFGVAKRAAMFEIETRAFNMSGPKEDQMGRARGQRPLLPGAPFVRRSTLPPAELLRALRQAKYPASLSKDAGRYLCNAVLYASLNDAAINEGAPLIVFTHIPAFGVETEVVPRLALEEAVDGAPILIRASAEAVLRNAALAEKAESRSISDGSQRLYSNGRGGGRILWRGRRAS